MAKVWSDSAASVCLRAWCLQIHALHRLSSVKRFLASR